MFLSFPSPSPSPSGRPGSHLIAPRIPSPPRAGAPRPGDREENLIARPNPLALHARTQRNPPPLSRLFSVAAGWLRAPAVDDDGAVRHQTTVQRGFVFLFTWACAGGQNREPVSQRPRRRWATGHWCARGGPREGGDVLFTTSRARSRFSALAALALGQRWRRLAAS